MKNDITYLDFAQERTLRHVQFLSPIEVNWQGLSVTDKPMATYGIGSCRATILYYNGVMGLSHIYSSSNPKGHIKTMLDILGGKSEEISAMVVAGENVRSVESCLNEYGVKIVNRMIEGSQSKDVIVIPSRKEVRLYTKNSSSIHYF